ncbi:MAG: TetR family transcriptional regulator [Alphaproteobacteria bacterium]|nr:TetR family transcriptional regulator [Alphaproteobacteria bacterium]
MTAAPPKRPSDSLRDPEWTKARLLEAARGEFSDKGLSGARVNAIAAAAGVNKQLLYYYFGDKESLYTAVLQQAYEEIRIGEQELDLERLPPEDAMRTFIEFNFDYMVSHRYFVALLGDENLHEARHVRDSVQLSGLHARLEQTIGGTLARGRAAGVFVRDIEPVDLYITIASLCFFHLSNRHTLSAIFGRDFTSDTEIAHRREHVVDLLMSFLKSAPASE